MTRRPRAALLVLLALVVAPHVNAASAPDLDRDGIPDALEQALLDRFVPTLVLSAGECDGLPAAILPGVADPVLAARDGTLYGHAVRRPSAPGAPAEIEIKYFHLWGRDCGRPSHAWDVERVSVLLRADSVDASAEAWQAAYWYAAAHEGTICDASSGAHAATLRATTGGPYVYVSRGKHASYLARGHCKWGCGSDLCDSGGTLLSGRVVNIGEPGAPLNGAAWSGSRRWPLAAKLATDFDADLRSRFDRVPPRGVLALRLGLRPLQAPILGGDTGLDALVETGESVTVALGAAAEATATAAERSGRAVVTALDKTLSGLARFFRLK